MSDLSYTVVADVALTLPGWAPTVLTYAVSEELQSSLEPGVPVIVPIRGQSSVGYILRLRKVAENDEISSKLLDITRIATEVPPLTGEHLQLALWLSDTYLASFTDCVRTVSAGMQGGRPAKVIVLTERGRSPEAWADKDLHRSAARVRALEHLSRTPHPVSFRNLHAAIGEIAGEVVRWLNQRGYVEIHQPKCCAPRPREVMAVMMDSGYLKDKAILTASQQRVVDALAQHEGPMPIAELCKRAKVARATVDSLERRGVIKRMTITQVRRAVGAATVPSLAPTYTDEQRNAIAAIIADLSAPPEQKRPILVHGITASGKTEVYLEAIRVVREQGRTALVLVPEIALASQVVDVVAGRFGSDVALLHSRLSSGERFDEWRRVQEGAAGVAVGARSAAFAPLQNLGLIVVDEEHETAYKQETSPRYHALDVALVRARRSSATVVLGTATPSLEAYYAARSGEMTLVTLKRRVTGGELPRIVVVDMRREFRKGPVLFSTPLVEEIRARLERKEQALLFLNRRGYASFVLCRDCGFVAKCPHCAVSLTYHAAQDALICHHCNHVERQMVECPDCQGTRLRGFGLGTERIEQEIVALFPTARVLRMDRDTTSRKGAHARMIRAFRNGEADILVGTQMVAKGLDFPNLTLVGVVSADVGLHIPDFRASERTFQTLAQVAGRAGRSGNDGLVIIQSFTPDHYAVQCAAKQDYEQFFAIEIEQRRQLRYPPFTHLVNIVGASRDLDVARGAVLAIAEFLRTNKRDGVEITGPAPAPIARLRDEYRWHVLVRCPDRALLIDAVRNALNSISASLRRHLTVDVDPISLA